MKANLSKLAPVCPTSRRIVAKELGRKKVSDREIAAWSMERGFECRVIPEKAAIADRLLREAWELVHRLIEDGVKFPGTAAQATLVIGGTAYAAWRSALDRRCRDHEDAHLVMVVAGLNAGLEFARRHTTGMPRMYAMDYIDTVADSTDALDHVPMMDTLAKLWPKTYGGGKLRFRTPRYVTVGTHRDSWDAEFWVNVPNVLNASKALIVAASKRKPL